MTCVPARPATSAPAPAPSPPGALCPASVRVRTTTRRVGRHFAHARRSELRAVRAAPTIADMHAELGRLLDAQGGRHHGRGVPGHRGRRPRLRHQTHRRHARAESGRAATTVGRRPGRAPARRRAVDAGRRTAGHRARVDGDRGRPRAASAPGAGDPGRRATQRRVRPRRTRAGRGPAGRPSWCRGRSGVGRGGLAAGRVADEERSAPGPTCASAPSTTASTGTAGRRPWSATAAARRRCRRWGGRSCPSSPMTSDTGPPNSSAGSTRSCGGRREGGQNAAHDGVSSYGRARSRARSTPPAR